MGGKSQKGWGAARSKGKEGLFWGATLPGSPETWTHNNSLLRRRLYIMSGFRHQKIALIREKATLLFQEYFILELICLSGAESTQKITANSTYWEAKLNGAGVVARSKGKKGYFGGKTGSVIFLKKPAY